MSNVLGIDMGAAYAKAIWIPNKNSIVNSSPHLIPVRNPKDEGATFRVCGVKTGNKYKLLSTDLERRQALEDALPIVENVKPRRGESNNIDELEIVVLKKILDSYQSQADDFDLSKLKHVILSHPVSAGLAHVKALVQLAISAGIPAQLIDTIEEPVALALFSARNKPNLKGTVIVVDAGHYTTDLVHVHFDLYKGIAKALEKCHFPLRLGVSEICHYIASEIWLKAQMVASVEPSLAPFDEEGPESSNILVRHLCGLVENEVLRARDMEMFNAEIPANFIPWQWPNGDNNHHWLSSAEDPVNFPFDAAAAKEEDLDDYPKLDQHRFANKIRKISFRDAIRRPQYVLGATLFSSIVEADKNHPVAIVLGGGMTLIREIREGLERILGKYRLNLLNVDYEFSGFGKLKMGPLLGVAAGSAISGTRRFLRRNTLADTIGVGPLWYPTVSSDTDHDGALDLLLTDDSNLALSEQRLPIWTAENGAQLFPTGSDESLEEWMPIYRVLAVRGTEIPEESPLSIELTERVFPYSGGAPLYLVQFNDASRTTAGTIKDIDALAELIVPEGDDEGLRLALEIRRNEVWRLVVLEPSGKVVAESEYKLTPLSRGNYFES